MPVWRRIATCGLVVALAACGPLYGAAFDHPQAAPVPPGATVLTTDEASDQDDPLRSRQQVLDIGGTTQARLLAYYRAAYPASEGWEEMEVGDDQQLCLVKKDSAEYVEAVEVYGYRGTRVPATPTRRLVTVSRLADPSPPVCGAALGWIDVTLFATGKDQEWGTIDGQLLLDSGGVFGDSSTPLSPGTITLVGPTTITAPVDQDGAFEVQAPPGRYAISGTSPVVGAETCDGDRTVVSEAGLLVTADVVCPAR